MRRSFVFLCVLLVSLLAVLVAPTVAVDATSARVVVQQSSATTPSPQLVFQSQGNPDVKVWVNSASGVYHCPGTRWYGKTKQGEYMTQKQAQEKGYRPAYGKFCQ